MANISVIMPSEITYVTGLVNKVQYTFTLSGVNLWSAEVERAANDIYTLELQAIDGAGNVTEYSTTLYYGLHLVRDRTQADIDRYLYLNELGFDNMTDEEKAEWLSDLKGAYNYTDLNRVESAVQYIHDRFLEYGYHTDVDTFNMWDISMYPTETECMRYLQNVRNLRGIVGVYESTPDTPLDMEGFTYQEANAIEQILYDIDMLITNMVSVFRYSNEFYGGES